MFHDTKYVPAKNTNLSSLCNCVVTQQPSGQIKARAGRGQKREELETRHQNLTRSQRYNDDDDDDDDNNNNNNNNSRVS